MKFDPTKPNDLDADRERPRVVVGRRRRTDAAPFSGWGPKIG